MSYIREIIFGQEQEEIPKPQVRAAFTAMLAITLLFAAWHYGIIASTVFLLRSVVIGIWDTLRDLAAALADFLKYVNSQGTR